MSGLGRKKRKKQNIEQTFEGVESLMSVKGQPAVKSGKCQKEILPTYDSYGFCIACQAKEGRSERLLLCVLKGFLTFCIIFGMEWFYLDAVQIEGSRWVIGGVLLIFSLLLGLLYYSRLSKNLGYVGVLAYFVVFAMSFSKQANSGFAAILNETYRLADLKFHLPARSNFFENTQDRMVSVTLCMILIGCVGAVLMNIIISGHMSFVFAGAAVLLFPAMVLYLDGEVSYGATFLLAFGFFMVYMLRMEGHYRSEPDGRSWVHYVKLGHIFRRKEKLSKKNEKRVPEKELFRYTTDAKTMMGSLAQFFCGLLAVAMLLVYYVPKENVSFPDSWGNLRNQTDEGVRRFFAFGMAGLFRFDSGTGGLSHGRLGIAGSVYPDNETDFRMTFIPWNYERIYLKGYTGGDYNYDKTLWEPLSEEVYQAAEENGGTPVLKDSIERYSYMRLVEQEVKGNSNHMAIAIETVDDQADTALIPYYSGMGELAQEYRASYEQNDGNYQIGFYNWKKGAYEGVLENIDSLYEEREQSYLAYVKDNFLQVPEELKPMLEEVSKEANLSGSQREELSSAVSDSTTVGSSTSSESDEEIIENLMEFFRTEFTYTLTPGYFTWGRDYVTNFLTGSRRGFCAHFATAATLLLRYNGIPARYCEGYAVDYEEFVGGRQVSNAAIQSEFRGSTDWDDQIMVEVDVPDADAHAWVEVYVDSFGWVPVEMTTAPSETEHGSFLSDFFGMFDEEEQQEEDSASGAADAGETTAPVKLTTVILLLALVGYWSIHCYRQRRFLENGTSTERIKKKFKLVNQKLIRYGLEQKPGETLRMYQARLEALKTQPMNDDRLLEKRMKLWLFEQFLPILPIMEQVLYARTCDGEKEKELEELLNQKIYWVPYFTRRR